LSPTSWLILFGLLICLAAFSNWARLCLLSLKPSRLEELLGKGKEGGRQKVWRKAAEGLFLSTIVANNAAKVASPLVLFAWLSRVAPELTRVWTLAISFLASAACVLLFAEGLPRVLVTSRREPTMRFAILPLLLLNSVVFPVRLAFRQLSLIIGKLLRRNAGGLTLWPPQAAGRTVWDPEGRETQLQDDEKVLISSIFDMTETIVREVMVPRVDMHCLEEGRTLAEVREQILHTGHSRFPVYSGDIDNMVGLFLGKDLLKYYSQEELAAVRVRDMMHPITFVPETKNVSDLLREFQQTRRHMAVVVDEYGSTAGLVTIEDLLEEIVGEIEDEFDQERKLFVETKDGGFIVDAKMSISDAAEEIGIKLPDNSEYDTIGGFVVATLGKVPQEGETFQSNGVSVTVVEADDRRVHRVKLLPLAEKKATEEKEGTKQ